ncbi:MAG: hypothetical protein JO079_04825 [Frankiaceae bacterium]|nr:hypothetical protein [Frankiaceae bacterium]
MTRRKAFLAALALCGGLAASAAPLSSAAPTVPPQCGPHPVLTQYEGNYYVWVQNPGGNPCWLSVEIPGNIQQPPHLPPPPTVKPAAGAAVYPPEPCPTHVLVTQSNGDYTLWLPNPTRTSCWIAVTIPTGSIVVNPPAPAVGFPPPCPVQPLVYESNGHDYLSLPDPTGKSCRIVIELPVTVPPTR